MSPDAHAGLARKAEHVQIMLLDVDGVLTDGSIMLGADGQEIKRFDVQDGQGIVMAREVGLKVGIITGRKSIAVEQRAKELKLDVVHQGRGDKVESMTSILKQFDLRPEQAAYIGDDWTDILVMKSVGLPLAVANARPEVQAVASHVSENPGGHGAVRELIEWLLELRGEKEKIFANYLQTRKKKAKNQSPEPTP